MTEKSTQGGCSRLLQGKARQRGGFILVSWHANQKLHRQMEHTDREIEISSLRSLSRGLRSSWRAGTIAVPRVVESENESESEERAATA